MSISTGATDVVGGYPAAYAGGLGGGIGQLGLVGLIGLNSFLGNRGFGDGFGTGVAGAVPGTTVLEQNVSELRKDVAGVNTTVEALGNELQGAIFNLNSGLMGEFRNLDNQICDSEKEAMKAAFNATIQGMQNTQLLSNQMTAFQVSTDKQFCEVKEAIHADGDQTRQLINSIEMQNLRDALEMERRGRSEREIEINITNSNTSLQSQIALQAQQQQQQFASFANLVSDQLARQANSIVNLGTMTASGQTNSAAQTKVNS